MKIALFARFASLLLVLTLLVSAASAGKLPSPARHYKGGLHRPVYKAYKPAKSQRTAVRLPWFGR